MEMGKTLQKIKVSQVNEMPKNLGKTVTIGSHEIALFHLANGEFGLLKIVAHIKVGFLWKAL